jgi:hypothetical protein
MANIVVRRISSTDMPAELARMVEPILRRWEAAVVRVAQAHGTGQKFKGGTPEALLHQRFTKLPAEIQNVSHRRATEALSRKSFTDRAAATLSVDVTDLKADLAGAKLAIPAFADQARAQTQTVLFLKTIGLDPAVRPAGPRPPNAPTKLTLRMQRLVCVDETNAVWPWGERGQDEIHIGGAVLDTDQTTSAIPDFDCGKYDDSTRRDFQPFKELATVSLANKTFPRAYFASFVLVEVDNGGMQGVVKEIVDKLASEAKTHLSAWLAGLAAGGAIGGPVGAVIGLVVAWLVDKLVAKIASWWGDDPFTPATIMATFPNAGADFNGKRTMPSEVVRFRGPGEYAMRYDWKLS